MSKAIKELIEQKLDLGILSKEDVEMIPDSLKQIMINRLTDKPISNSSYIFVSNKNFIWETDIKSHIRESFVIDHLQIALMPFQIPKCYMCSYQGKQVWDIVLHYAFSHLPHRFQFQVSVLFPLISRKLYLQECHNL